MTEEGYSASDTFEKGTCGRSSAAFGWIGQKELQSELGRNRCDLLQQAELMGRLRSGAGVSVC